MSSITFVFDSVSKTSTSFKFCNSTLIRGMVDTFFSDINEHEKYHNDTAVEVNMQNRFIDVIDNYIGFLSIDDDNEDTDNRKEIKEEGERKGERKEG